MENVERTSNNYAIVNGNRFDIKYNFTVLCSYCGAACMGTYLLWYVRDRQRIALETDTGTLEDIMNTLVGVSIDRDDYANLPSLLRQWNEDIDWCEAEDGVIIDRVDLLQAIDRIAAATDRAFDPQHLADTLTGIRALITESIAVGSQIWMMRN